MTSEAKHTALEGEEKGPVRTCFACRHSGSKGDMLRVVVDGEGQLWPDLLQQAPGRGAYLCLRESCWARLSDKRLGALKAKLDIAAMQWQPFRRRFREALYGRIRQLLTQIKGGAGIGRDAVMQHLWKNSPRVLLVADDAGEALIRQLQDAVAKRGQAGVNTRWCAVPASGQLGDWLGREKVSVLAIGPSAQSERLEKAFAWLRLMNEVE